MSFVAKPQWQFNCLNIFLGTILGTRLFNSRVLRPNELNGFVCLLLLLLLMERQVARICDHTEVTLPFYHSQNNSKQ